MGDYVGAEQGKLVEIRFDKVYLCDPPQRTENSRKAAGSPGRRPE